eukprot:CAMPEP_0171094022 /NCGR_PEP_ID=MMETSP0766_2-20121228/39613_1 /TAXON_ID=439317 /ORGANISM="Gambierdiscus australes, Strain CAWD 149" /LENGTH=107 /DNA_ID=CAMNT_0011552557 /DNA_START=90 /DNA_END=414 /DNA_ORIENTATION=-
MTLQGCKQRSGATNNDVVDGNEDELHSITNEAHDGKADGTSHCDLLEFFGIGLCAPLDQAARVVRKLVRALHHKPIGLFVSVRKGMDESLDAMATASPSPTWKKKND